MHVVWKRPDGFHSVSPSDFRVAEINSTARIWLHKKDTENYPFRISGGWQDEEATKRINTWINLVGEPAEKWLEKLLIEHSNSSIDEPAKFTAKLREYKTDNNLLLLKTEMNAGHGGKSGRDGAIEEIATDYAFALKITKKF